MNGKIRQIVKRFIPPILLSLKNKTSSKYGYFGDYKNWEEVEKISSGYSSDTIIEKVRSGALKVKNGEAVYERDSVVFNKVDMSWPLLSGLLWIAGQNENHLRVIDFGGSLGTSYYQNRIFLKHLEELQWDIIEQDKFVDIGNREFKDDVLSFYYEKDLEKLAETKKSNVMVISSSLQFLPDPYDFIRKVSTLNIPYLIFDKIPFSINSDDNNRLMLQKVPPKIYDASYPVWIFGLNNFLSKVGKCYELIADFDAYPGYIQDIKNGQMHYKGFIFKKY